MQQADARFVASFGRGQRHTVGVDRVRDPLNYLFAGSDLGDQLDVVGYLLSRFRWPSLHLPSELGCPRHYENLVLSSAAPPGASLPDALFTRWAGLRGGNGPHCGHGCLISWPKVAVSWKRPEPGSCFTRVACIS